MKILPVHDIRCVLLAAALLAMAAGAPVAAEPQLVRQEDAVVALFSLQTGLEVELRLLHRTELRHEELQRMRDEATARVGKLYAELDHLFTQYQAALRGKPGKTSAEPGAKPDLSEREAEQSPETLQAQLQEKEQEVLAAERAEAWARDEGRRMREQIDLQREKISLISQRIDSLRAGLPSHRDSLTGVWDLTMLPGGEKGVFALFQSGTLVTGQYVLDGPFQGSLDGTLIERKLLLHRIDSRLGRSMDFSGFLSSDGQAIKGTWENYDLSNGQPHTGSWSARRRQARRPGQEDDGREGGSPP